MKTLLVDDHALFRAGLRLLLRTLRADIEVLEAATIGQALDAVQAHPDLQLCLLDLALKDENGLDALVRIKSAAPEVGIVIVSGSEEPATMRACIDAGAMSFIPKSVTPDVLLEALRSVIAGAVWLPEPMIALERGASMDRSIPKLTTRQLDVMRCLNRGLPTKSISRELGLSENTVKEHLASIFRVLGVGNRTQAVIEAGRLGIGARS